MSRYWPRRPSPEGFSIERLAKKYREKLANNFAEDPIPPTEMQVTAEETRVLLRTNTPDELKTSRVVSIHWANRDFKEYREVA